MAEQVHRKIIHVDMDAFYASVEQLDNPELRGKAIAVGGGEERGVVAAASYEARKFGVRSAMASALAKRKCPDLIFVKPRFERYKEVSSQIRKIFRSYTALVEPLSLDEAFLDVTDNMSNHSSASEIAEEIRERIYVETGLTASAGISINKFLAKMASDINKPNGQKTIKPHEVETFLERLPIDKFFGIGKSTTEKMHSWGIFNGGNLKDHSLAFLTKNFGKAGQHYYNIVRGIQTSPVKPDRVRKSVGAERTFTENVVNTEMAVKELERISEIVKERMIAVGKKGRTITIKVKFSDFTQISRSKSLEEATHDQTIIFNVAQELWMQEVFKKSVRLLGISVSNLEDMASKAVPKEYQLKLKF
jgi:DNA polymerase-4